MDAVRFSIESVDLLTLEIVAGLGIVIAWWLRLNPRARQDFRRCIEKVGALRSIELQIRPPRVVAHFNESAVQKSMVIEDSSGSQAVVDAVLSNELFADLESRTAMSSSIEQRSMKAAIDYEVLNGRAVTDVSALFVGYDVQSVSKTEIRLIEVKGKAKVGPVTITANEWRNAAYFGSFYFLYIVENLNSTEPVLKIVQDPAAVCKVEPARVQFLVRPSQYLPFAETVSINW